MEKIKNFTFIKRAAVCVFIAVAGIVSLVTFGGGKSPESDFTVVNESSEAAAVESGQAEPYDSMVYVCGAVKSPGVYKCTEGMRVADAINLAGGANENADLTSLNLAEFVEDASKIEVYELAAEAGQADSVVKEGGSGAGGDLININKADKDTLMTLAGVGESKALAIIDYRKTNGSFKKIEDIMNVSGIKEAGFNKIKDKIRV